MTGKTWAFEDFVEGASLDLGAKHVTADEIIEFASEFDAQPMHLDEAAGKASILGGLSASGWHTCAMFMRMLCDAFLLDSTSQGSPGIDHVKWKKPVLAGDTLSGTMHRARQARVADRGLARAGHHAQPNCSTSAAKASSSSRTPCMFLTREAAACMTLDEFFEIGVTVTLGSHTFEAGRHQGLRQQIRSAALPSRRGGGEEERASAGSAPPAGIRPRPG